MIAQAMGIQRYIFFSIHNAEKHPEVPLMQVKTCTEKFVQQSGLNYTIFRLCGFMQVSLLSYCPFGFLAGCKQVPTISAGAYAYEFTAYSAASVHNADANLLAQIL